jgi:hypothetical protein
MWHLLKPLILNILEKSGSVTLKDAREEVTARTARAYHALAEICSKIIILVSPAFSVWRLVALRPRFSSDIALIVRRELMDLLSWENLGKQVKLFAVLSREAECEGVEKLLPSVLCKRTPSSSDLAKLQAKKRKSLFFINKDDIVTELSNRALGRKSYSLKLHDNLVLCIKN